MGSTKGGQAQHPRELNLHATGPGAAAAPVCGWASSSSDVSTRTKPRSRAFVKPIRLSNTRGQRARVLTRPHTLAPATWCRPHQQLPRFRSGREQTSRSTFPRLLSWAMSSALCRLPGRPCWLPRVSLPPTSNTCATIQLDTVQDKTDKRVTPASEVGRARSSISPSRLSCRGQSSATPPVPPDQPREGPQGLAATSAARR